MSMAITSAETIKQALTRLGYSTLRVHAGSGRFVGMRIFKDGEQVHDTPIANVDYAIELIEANGGFIQEPSQ